MPMNEGQAPACAETSPEDHLRWRAQALSDLAIETLAKLMRGTKTPPPIKLAAAREVLDRGHGRPRIGAADEPGGGGMTVIVKRYSDVTPEELARAEEGEP